MGWGAGTERGPHAMVDCMPGCIWWGMSAACFGDAVVVEGVFPRVGVELVVVVGGPDAGLFFASRLDVAGVEDGGVVGHGVPGEVAGWGCGTGCGGTVLLVWGFVKLLAGNNVLNPDGFPLFVPNSCWLRFFW